MSKGRRVAPYKKKIVDDFANLLVTYPIIGALNMESMPSAQLNKMRKQLRAKVELRMTKRRLMKLAIEKAKEKKPGIEMIESYLKGMPALLFTSENPFTLYKTIKKSKSKAPAKPGQVAPYDLWVKAGPTSFMPGPIIGELGALGIKAGVEGGKISIKEDTIIVKEGMPINDKAASMLLRLGIEPMEVGLDLVAVYEKGIMYAKDVLDIDENVFNQKLMSACSSALNLAVFAAFPTKESTSLLIQKAFRQARTLALDNTILADGVTPEILANAERHALSLKSAGNIETVEKPRAETVKNEETSKEGAKKNEQVHPKKEHIKEHVPHKADERKEQPVQHEDKPKEQMQDHGHKEEPKQLEKKEEKANIEEVHHEKKDVEKVVHPKSPASLDVDAKKLIESMMKGSLPKK